MKVFISWSGDTSRKLAEALRSWIPGVIQAVQPYFTPDDVAKGTRWNTEIAKELSESKVGLICLTPHNLTAAWVMFEAGALSKNLERSRVCPLLFGVDPTDLTGPLVQFQASKFDKGEMRRVVKMINGVLGDAALAGEVLESVFDMWWPRLKEGVDKILSAEEGVSETSRRSERELIEEVLALSRSIARRGRHGQVNSRPVEDLITGYERLAVLGRELNWPGTFRETLESLHRPISYLSRRANPGLANKFRILRRSLEMEEPSLFTDDEGISIDLDDDEIDT